MQGMQVITSSLCALQLQQQCGPLPMHTITHIHGSPRRECTYVVTHHREHFGVAERAVKNLRSIVSLQFT